MNKETNLQGNKRNIAGGAATGAGINFQAAVTAIACTYMAKGKPLSWLDKVTEDIPTAVEAETGGAGDDIKLVLSTKKSVEIQVKKGLHVGQRLWSPLIKLAVAVENNDIDYGLLIICPDSSKTISKNLLKDIKRLGDGRTDNLSQIALNFAEQLKSKNIQVQEVCKKIRIHVIHATLEHQSHILLAQTELEPLCLDDSYGKKTWNVLYTDALDLIAQNGRRDVPLILNLFHSQSIKLIQNDLVMPIILLEQLCQWSFKNHETFSIIGIHKQLHIDKAWLPLNIVVKDDNTEEINNLKDALNLYYSWENRNSSSESSLVNPETLGRFVKHVVLIGGPGMGKSTIIKRIARSYSKDNIPVLSVKLVAVAARIRAGKTFEDSIFELGLDGIRFDFTDVKKASISNWLLLCDGLDECGSMQEEIASGAFRFSTGYPDCRIIITTRPIGYKTSYFSDWKHYYIEPLSSNSATENLTKLVTECASEKASLKNYDTAYKLCEKELSKNDHISKIVSRSPLMLGLASSIIIHGSNLGTTKVQLYEKIFKLIDALPNSRIQNQPTSHSELSFFLNLIAWYINTKPLSNVGDILDFCAAELANETGETLTKSKTKAESYLSFWLDVGLIEKIGHTFEETLVFIHKTFSEFAAARYLLLLPKEKQISKLKSVINRTEQYEIVHFSGLLGLADIVGEMLINESTEKTKVDNISLTLEIMSVAPKLMNQSLRSKIFNSGFNFISSPRESHAFKIGKSLINLAQYFPEELGSMAIKKLNDKQSWTHVISWAIVLVSGPDYYDINDLTENLDKVVSQILPHLHPSLGKGLVLNRSPEVNITKNFVVKAITVLLENKPSDVTFTYIFKIINDPRLHTFSFINKVKKLLRTKGKKWDIDKRYKTDFGSLGNWTEEAEYKKAKANKYKEIFNALEIPPNIFVEVDDSEILLYFSAFVESSSVWKIHGDVWSWNNPYDSLATKETIRGFIGLSGINIEKLKTDVMKVQSILQSDDSLSKFTTKVDIPEINWELASSLDLDVKRIETALFHPSQWIVFLSANLIINLLTPNKLYPVIKNMFIKGNGYTLWAAIELANDKLEEKQSYDLVIDKLLKPANWGNKYLFKFLKKRKIQWDDNLYQILNNGLESNLSTAIEAAKFVNKNAKLNDNKLAQIISDALVFWEKEEEPYPEDGGAIPDSPRSLLVEAQVKVQKLNYNNLKKYLFDPRSDVKDAAEKLLIDFIKVSGDLRIEFLKDINTEQVSPHVLDEALQAFPLLEENEIIIWKDLIKHKNAEIRYAAMEALDKGKIEPKLSKDIVNNMTKDPEQQIRSYAYRILDTM